MANRSTKVRLRLAQVGIVTVFSVVALSSSAQASVAAARGYEVTNTATVAAAVGTVPACTTPVPGWPGGPPGHPWPVSYTHLTLPTIYSV